MASAWSLRSNAWPHRRDPKPCRPALGQMQSVLEQTSGMDRLRAPQVRIVRIVLAPAAELIRFPAHTRVALARNDLALPSFTRLRIVQATAIYPASNSPRASPHKVRARISRSFSMTVMRFLRAKKPALEAFGRICSSCCVVMSMAFFKLKNPA